MPCENFTGSLGSSTLGHVEWDNIADVSVLAIGIYGDLTMTGLAKPAHRIKHFGSRPR